MIETEQTYIIYTADGTQRQWEFPYSFQEPTDVALYIRVDDEFEKVSSSLYTFDPETKKVTYPKNDSDDPVASGTKLMLIRETEVTQEEDSTVANFKSNDVERMADKLTLIAQEHKEWVSRCIKYDQVDAIGADTNIMTIENNLKEYADNAVATHNTSNAAHADIRTTLSLKANQSDLVSGLATKQDNLTASQLNAVNSGITADKVSGYDTHLSNSDIHVTAEQKTAWTAKQDAIADLSTIRSNATSAIQPTDVATTSSVGVVKVDGTSIVAAADGTISAQGATAVWGAITGTLSNQTDLQTALSGKQATLTAGSNITISDNTISATDTTYSAFTGADGTAAGTAGLVPAPAAADNVKYLKGDGTWATVDSLPSQTGNSGKFLTTNGSVASWATVSSYPTLTWYTGNTGTSVTIADTTSANLVKIYKNGILLEPTADYSISGTTLTLVTALVSTDKITLEVF